MFAYYHNTIAITSTTFAVTAVSNHLAIPFIKKNTHQSMELLYFCWSTTEMPAIHK